MVRADPDEQLAHSLQTLTSTTRIRLLRNLRQPVRLKDVQPFLSANLDRPLARQTIFEHLSILREAQLVESLGEGDDRHYVVNHQNIYRLSEELRELAKIKATVQLENPTRRASAASAVPHQRGPRFIQARGLEEGKVHALKSSPASPPWWVLGRRRDCDVSLDFDAYISSKNTEVRAANSEFRIRDVPQSQNGTTLNFELLEKGKEYRLVSGDLVGMGRSLLQFRS